MNYILLSVVLLGVTPDTAAPQPDLPAASVAAPLPPRRGVDLAEAAQAAMRRWSRVADEDAPAAAREYLAIYEELLGDDQLPRRQREQWQQKIRSRLIKLAPQVALRAAIERRLARQSPASVSIDRPVLGQFVGQQAVGMGAGRFGQPPVADDAGQDLVELIQKTIAPGTWSINGGPGAIHYWRPGRAIVVTATDDIHGDMGGLIGQLRRAGN